MSMIEVGLYQFITGNPAITPFLGTVDPQRKQFLTSARFSVLMKQQVFPAVTLDRLRSPDACDTLDARTSTFGQLIEGKFQFGSWAEDDANNPYDPDGYLSAAFLSQALRRQLTGLATGNAVLPDGTLVKDVNGCDEWDAHYEVGGEGYLFRRILQCTILFQEVS